MKRFIKNLRRGHDEILAGITFLHSLGHKRTSISKRRGFLECNRTQKPSTISVPELEIGDRLIATTVAHHQRGVIKPPP
jgi:hypothetical protein